MLNIELKTKQLLVNREQTLYTPENVKYMQHKKSSHISNQGLNLKYAKLKYAYQ